MNSPIQSAHEHLEAFLSQDVEKINETTLFPFIHVQPDGEFLSFNSAEELAPFGEQPFKSEIAQCVLLDSGEASAILSIIAQRFDFEGSATVQVKAVWGATKNEERWCIRWRHFLGEVQDAA